MGETSDLVMRKSIGKNNQQTMNLFKPQSPLPSPPKSQIPPPTEESIYQAKEASFKDTASFADKVKDEEIANQQKLIKSTDPDDAEKLK